MDNKEIKQKSHGLKGRGYLKIINRRCCRSAWGVIHPSVARMG